MKIVKVKKLKPLERFLYWIQERHKIYERREAGEKKPWTDDEVLQSYFFTNPYRENDKVTKWFRKNVREPLKNKDEVLFATVAFRWFNYIPTGEILLENDYLLDWDEKLVRKALKQANKNEPVFTGAFMIPAVPGSNKIEHVCKCLRPVWKDRKDLALEIRKSKSLQDSHKLLCQYPYLGKFMSYEVVTDLRHTRLLNKAVDIMTWANPGPGCARGLARLVGEMPVGKNSAMMKLPKDWLHTMQSLLEVTNMRLNHMPIFEMREIEHSLCEWDKYERALWQDGRMKRTYQGV